MRKKYHVKTGDKVEVISGKWKGSKAKIAAVLTKNDRVVLDMGALSEERQRQVGRRAPSRQERSAGQTGLVARSVSVHVSNVKLDGGK